MHESINQPKRTDASTAAAVAVAAPFAAEPLPPAALADFQPSSPPLEAGVAVDAGDGVTGTGGGASAPAPPPAFVAGGGVAGGAPPLSFLSPPLPPPPLQQSHRQKRATGREVSLVEFGQPRAHAFPLQHQSLLDRVQAQRSSSTRAMPTTRGSNRQVRVYLGVIPIIPARAAHAESKQVYKRPRLGTQPPRQHGHDE